MRKNKDRRRIRGVIVHRKHLFFFYLSVTVNLEQGDTGSGITPSVGLIFRKLHALV
jgi:hypothetical protein